MHDAVKPISKLLLWQIKMLYIFRNLAEKVVILVYFVVVILVKAVVFVVTVTIAVIFVVIVAIDVIFVVILVALVIVVVVVSPVDADDDEDHGGEVEAESAEECENFASHVSGKPKPE